MLACEKRQQQHLSDVEDFRQKPFCISDDKLFGSKTRVSYQVCLSDGA